MTTLIDGKKLAEAFTQTLVDKIASFKKQQAMNPGLAVVLIGDHPASQVYVRNKRRACERVGIENFSHDLPATTTEHHLLDLIKKLNADQRVHGILVQLPLPAHIRSEEITRAIDPAKDVDGFHPVNAGKLLLNQPGFRPCTPAGILYVLDAIGCDPQGKHAVVIGRSHIVGKPTALMLLDRHATVTVCHSKTRHLADSVFQADIVVAALGQPHFIKGAWIKSGATVIDVGINRLSDGKLVGDVEFDEAKKRAAAITPVPGGIGPMTIAMLLKNITEAAAHAATNAARK